MSCGNIDIIKLIDYFENGTDLSAYQFQTRDFYELWNAVENGVSPSPRIACDSSVSMSVRSVIYGVLGTFTTPSEFVGGINDFYYLYLKAIGQEFLSPVFVNECIMELYNVFAVSGGFDTDYQAVLDYATLQGYTLPSSEQQILQNQIIIDAKANNIWNEIGSFGITATDGDRNFAKIDWKRLVVIDEVNSPSFGESTGFTSGAGGYLKLNTSFNLIPNFALNNNSYGVFVDKTGDTGGALIGANTAAFTNLYTNNFAYNNMGGVGGNFSNGSPSSRFLAASKRTSPTQHVRRVNNTEAILNNASLAINTLEVFLMCRNDNGVAANFNNRANKGWFVGSGFDLSLLDDIVETYLNSI